jgi:hypothetical protein
MRDEDMTSEPTDRVDQFKAEIAEMKLKTGRTRTDRTFEIVGAVLMVAGIVIAFGAYAASLNVKAAPAGNIDVLNSNSYIALAIAGLAVSVMGGFVFLRYSLARFLRFWLLRQTYEQRVAIDEAAAVREG